MAIKRRKKHQKKKKTTPPKPACDNRKKVSAWNKSIDNFNWSKVDQKDLYVQEEKRWLTLRSYFKIKASSSSGEKKNFFHICLKQNETGIDSCLQSLKRLKEKADGAKRRLVLAGTGKSREQVTKKDEFISALGLQKKGRNPPKPDKVHPIPTLDIPCKPYHLGLGCGKGCFFSHKSVPRGHLRSLFVLSFGKDSIQHFPNIPIEVAYKLLERSGSSLRPRLQRLPHPSDQVQVEMKRNVIDLSDDEEEEKTTRLLPFEYICTKCEYRRTSKNGEDRVGVREEFYIHYLTKHSPVAEDDVSVNEDGRNCYKCTVCTFSSPIGEIQECAQEALEKLMEHIIEVHDIGNDVEVEVEEVKTNDEVSSPLPEERFPEVIRKANPPVLPIEDSSNSNADTPSSPPKTDEDLRMEEMSSAQSPDMQMDSSDPVDPHRMGEDSLDEVSVEKTVAQVDLSSPGDGKGEESSPDSPEDEMMRGIGEKQEDSISCDECSSREPKSPDGPNGTPVSSLLEEESQSQSSLPPPEELPVPQKLKKESKKVAKVVPPEDVDGEIMDEEEEKDEEDSVKAVSPPPAPVKPKHSSKEKTKEKESKSKESSKRKQREESVGGGGGNEVDPAKRLLAEVKERDKSEKEKEREKRRREKKRSREDKKEEERQMKKKMSDEEEEGPGEEFLLVRGASPSDENWEEFGGQDDRRVKSQRRRDSEGSGSPQNRQQQHHWRPEVEASPIRSRPGSERGKRMERREPKSDVSGGGHMNHGPPHGHGPPQQHHHHEEVRKKWLGILAELAPPPQHKKKFPLASSAPPLMGKPESPTTTRSKRTKKKHNKEKKRRKKTKKSHKRKGDGSPEESEGSEDDSSKSGKPELSRSPVTKAFVPTPAEVEEEAWSVSSPPGSPAGSFPQDSDGTGEPSTLQNIIDGPGKRKSSPLNSGEDDEDRCARKKKRRSCPSSRDSHHRMSPDSCAHRNKVPSQVKSANEGDKSSAKSKKPKPNAPVTSMKKDGTNNETSRLKDSESDLNLPMVDSDLTNLMKSGLHQGSSGISGSKSSVGSECGSQENMLHLEEGEEGCDSDSEGSNFELVDISTVGADWKNPQPPCPGYVLAIERHREKMKEWTEEMERRKREDAKKKAQRVVREERKALREAAKKAEEERCEEK